MNGARNVLGGPLEVCGVSPLTGFARDGRCHTGPQDLGSHTVCAQVTEAFLAYSQDRGNDLVTRWGAEEGAELKARILALMEELQQTVLDDSRSRKSVTERAIEQLRPRHPELDDTGLKALAWTFSFGLR